jgi:hypothetical protein
MSGVLPVGTGGSFGSASLQQEIGLGVSAGHVTVELRWSANGPQAFGKVMSALKPRMAVGYHSVCNRRRTTPLHPVADAGRVAALRVGIISVQEMVGRPPAEFNPTATPSSCHGQRTLPRFWDILTHVPGSGRT